MTAPLFYVDNMPYTQPDCDQIVQCLEERPEFQEPAGCRFAVCLQDTAHWLALCLWLKSLGASVLPIHSGTPYAAARTLAEGCNHSSDLQEGLRARQEKRSPVFCGR